MNFFLQELKSLLSEVSRKLKHILWGTAALQETVASSVRERINDTNVRRLLPFFLFILVTEISNIITDLSTKAHPHYEMGYLIANLFLLFFTIAYLVSFCILKKRLHRKRTFFISYWIVFSAGALQFCALDMAERASLNNYIMLTAVTAIVMLFSLKEAVGILLCYCILECTVIIVTGQEAFLAQQAILITVMGTVASQILYTSYVSSLVMQLQLEESNERLEGLSRTDSLTGLYNRRGFEAHLQPLWERWIETACPITLAIVDIDFFKMYNDKFGHLKGDDCLRAVSECIIQTVDQSFTLTARFGGEEFTILAYGNHDVAAQLAAVREGIEALKMSAGDASVSPFVTVSIGAATVVSGNGITFSTLFEAADRQLYMAKNSGRNQICHNML